MAKRRSEYELTRDNWDKEEEPEEVGHFQLAPEDVLKTRVIKQAKRRLISSPSASSESEPKSIFSSFNAFAGTNDTKKFSFGTNLKTSNNNSNANPLLKPSISDTNPSGVAFAFLSKSSDSKDSKSESIKSSANDTASKSDSSNNREKLNELSNELKKTTDNRKNPSNAANSEANGEETPHEIFLRKLKSLNLLCAEWIIKHLNESLDYILTPIFDDYAKHLKQLREERQNATSSKKLKIEDTVETTTVGTAKSSVSVTDATPMFKVPDFKESLSKMNTNKGFFSSAINKYNESQSNFKSPSLDTFKVPTTSENTGNGFKFPSTTVGGGFKLFKDDSKSSGDATSFLFGGQTSSSETKPVADSLAESKPLSFFSFKPDSLGNNPFVKPVDNAVTETNTKSEENDEDQPPVVADETITEEGSIYDKKCKVFIKKDGNFVDHGVGFLFLKLVGDEKCQVIVRANNKLKNIIINTLLTSSVPVQLLKKNNVMIVCCPTPEEKKPTSVLFRVKTPEDAEELLNTMNKYKK